MRQLTVIGNWKLHGSLESAATLIRDIRTTVDRKNGVEVGVCVPFTLIPKARELLEGSLVKLGSQNVADQASGAFTGEVSAQMLSEFDCGLAIVGHSERRLLYGESNNLVAQRFKEAINGGITPVLCVGETLEDRENDRTFEVVGAQLDAVLAVAPAQDFDRAIVAYEPVWAIGTGKTATSNQAQEVHGFIRTKLAEQNSSVAANLRILYGGSVKPENSAELFSMPDIDGGLIGGASLNAESFLSICYAL